MNWSVKCRDGDELRVYIENGCTKGLKPAEIREKFPQFKKYQYSTFNSAYASARKSYNNQVRGRGVKKCKLELSGLLL